MFDQFASSLPVHSKAHQFDATGQAVRDRECKRFDGKLHNEITNAKTVGEWEALADKIIKAAKVGNYREPHGLRDSVLERFIAECPFGPVKRRYYEGVKVVDDARNRFFIPQQPEKPKPTRQQIEAKKKANRDARHAAQPQRGASSGGGQKPGKQKGGKK